MMDKSVNLNTNKMILSSLLYMTYEEFVFFPHVKYRIYHGIKWHFYSFKLVV